jgi:eukaryotic-like serine/threonine-protein kinase
MTELSVGTLFANRFEVDRPAGKGGMGTVYRARDRYSGELVALKLLHGGAFGSDEAARFAREAELLSELYHPGIVSYVGHGEAPNGQRFLAMEWLEGEDLSRRLARGGPMPLGDCCALLERVASALAVAHQGGVIHRDLKPSNLFLPGGLVEQAKILDFGIARRENTSQILTGTGVLLGTPEYMAPEQVRGARDLTPAADMFSLGCVLYECLTGLSPFAADHVAAALVQILFEEPAPVVEKRPGVPASIIRLLERLLAKEVARRLPDASALQVELSALGEMREPVFAATIESPKATSSTFARSEQSLCSVVLASWPEDDSCVSGEGATQQHDEITPLPGERDSIVRALHSLGVSADFLASGTLVVMAPPTGSATDQAVRAARAALLIKERWPRAAVSVATGRGVIQGRSAVGEVVDRAARLLRSDDGYSVDRSVTGVFVDELSAKLLGGRFAQAPRHGGALLLAEALEVDAGRPLLGKPTPCVGREAELTSLEAQLTSAIEESEARAVLFTAPPGAGKSRLRHAFLRRVLERSDPVTLLFGRGDVMSAGSPYGILVDAIRRLCGLRGGEPLDEQRRILRARVAQSVAAAELERVAVFLGEMCETPFSEEGSPMLKAARQEPKLMRDSLRRALLDWLAAECRRAPVLLVLDDLQWSDALTVAAVGEALREQEGAPLFVLAFARPEIHEAFPKLWHGRTVQEIPLKGLSKKACERLIKHALGEGVSREAMAAAIEQSAGNALFLEELIRAIAEGKPEEQPSTVVAMLQARIGRLDGGARRAVRAASVFGQTFWQGGVGAVLGLPKASVEVEGWLSALADAELIEPRNNSRLSDEKEYGFRHALVRDAAYGLLTASDLLTGHLLAAEFLEAAPGHDAGAVAEHWQRGGDERRAASFYLRAAEGGLERGDHSGALRHVEQGLGCAPDGELLGQLCSVESYASLWLNRHDRLAEASSAAMTRLRAGSLGFCRAALPSIVAALGSGNMPHVVETLSLLLATDPDEGARAAYIEAVANVTTLLAFTATPAPLVQESLRRLGAIVDLAEPTNPAIRRHLHDARGSVVLFRQPRPWTMVTEWRAALKSALEAGDSRLELSLHASIEWGFFDLGDIEGAARRLSALEAPMSQSQDIVMFALWRHRLARILCELKDPSALNKAEDLVAPMLVQGGGLAHLRALAQGLMARVELLRGRPDSANEHARAAMEWFPAAPLWLMQAASVHIRALSAIGRAGEAAVEAARILAMIPELGGAGHVEVELRLAASEAFLEAGDVERARSELREARRQVGLRAEDITDPSWKQSYLSRNPYSVRVQELGRAWGGVCP